MSTQLKLRRGTTAQHSTFTGAEGEITVDTTKDTVVVHDGATAGGIPLAKESALSSYLTTSSAASTYQTQSGMSSYLTTSSASSTYAPLASPTFTGSITASSGTANGVAYLNGSKVLTTGSALGFNGSILEVNTSSAQALTLNGGGTNTGSVRFKQNGVDRAYFGGANWAVGGSADDFALVTSGAYNLLFGTNNAEQMRLTSTGLGIGTSSPGAKLEISGSSGVVNRALRITPAAEADIVPNLRTSSIQRVGNDSVLAMGYATTPDAWYISASYGVTGAFKPLAFATSDVERMRLDSSGNLGLGVTPSAWWGGVKAFDVNTVSSLSGGSNFMNLMTNGYLNSSLSYIYKTSSYATLYQQSSNGQHQWYTAPSGTAGNAISFTQAMTLDASGNLGIGTGSPVAFGAGYVNAQVNGTAGSFLNLSVNGTRTGYMYADVNGVELGSVTNTYTRIMTNNTERMRIDSNGYVGIGTTSPYSYGRLTVQAVAGGNVLTVRGGDSASQSGQICMQNTYAGVSTPSKSLRVNNSGYFEIVNDAYSAVIFQMTDAGAVYNKTGTWGTISDERVKENISDARSYIDDLCRLRVVKYSLKSDKLETADKLGFIAQEVEQVFPALVESSPNEMEGIDDFKTIKLSVLTPMLIKAIQEQQETIEQLKADVAALKAN